MKFLSVPFPAQIGDAWNLASAVVFGIHLLRTELHSRALPQNKALPIIALQVCCNIHLVDFTYSISDRLSCHCSRVEWVVLWALSTPQTI
jgi:hypothetical protein